VRLASVGDQNLAVGLEWGSGLLGTWGLSIGPVTMAAPPAMLSRGPDRSLDISPGVRIRHALD